MRPLTLVSVCRLKHPFWLRHYDPATRRVHEHVFDAPALWRAVEMVGPQHPVNNAAIAPHVVARIEMAAFGLDALAVAVWRHFANVAFHTLLLQVVMAWGAICFADTRDFLRDWVYYFALAHGITVVGALVVFVVGAATIITTAMHLTYLAHGTPFQIRLHEQRPLTPADLQALVALHQ
jgi:hypothetical protein